LKKHLQFDSELQGKDSIENDVEQLKVIIRDYAQTHIKPRDFNADLPILSALGATEYDKIEDMSKFQIKLEKALKKFVKDWKTLD
jgi:hypothetical protein